MTRRVLVVTHTGRPDAVLAQEQVLRELRAAGVEPVTEGPGVDPTTLEAAIVLGGDGTVLRAAELTRGGSAPLLGVNLGHVGFLAEAEREDLAEAVRRLVAGDYAVEQRRTLDVQVLPAEGGPTIRDWALNEATIEKADRQRMIEVVLEVDGRPLSTFGCDGVVLSTPTGSTAHAFSAGGPVVWPDVHALLAVPLSAHALFARPLVVGPRSVLAVEIRAPQSDPAVLTCDGRRMTPLAAGSRIEVRSSPTPVRLARLSTAPFTARLVHRFNLPVEGWRGRPDRVPGADRGPEDPAVDPTPAEG